MSAYYVKGDPLMESHTPSSEVSAGAMIVFGDEVRIAHRDIIANATGSLAFPGANAIYDVTKAASAGVTFSDGDEVFLDETNQLAVATDGGDGSNKHLGTAVAAAANADSSVRIVHDKMTVPAPV